MKCYFCGKEFNRPIIYAPICPYCNKDNDEDEINKYIEKKNKMKTLFGTKNDVDISFRFLCNIEESDSFLVYNKFTKIVYIRQKFTIGTDDFQNERLCPFISPNGKYYRYSEETGKLEEIE